ncbi:acyl-homoserine-lactone synthase [Rhodovulum sulfidophilum]|uniref:Acyl-homoserine-lactone synthase n=1 Tax=Rhodovulum sulfidophilum TaxID=35806 RepID=A0ABS1RSB9_RHOSU|nr:acyl-homoserine-lactone synthase [Rhodovulum sulfidophilum]MBL3608944.1 autoinducer synthase [Rhodovulum sulfidophilum]MCE8455842.1 autoinducer synthase [Rhodovulum sulfidophilum]
MLRYIYGVDLHKFPLLRDTMFRDRARQFHDRLGWAVTVNDRGEERDQYDGHNPLYVIWEQANGRHGGSMRFLPTTGRTMVNEHFLHVTGGVRIESPLIWECTRFCLAPDAGREVTAGLVLGAGEVMAQFAVEHFVAVFDLRLARIYRVMGVEPDVIGAAGNGRNWIGLGLWEMQEAAWPRTLARLGIGRETSLGWFRASFSAPTAAPRELAVA